MPPCSCTIWTTGQPHFLALQPPCYILPWILCLETPLLLLTNNKFLAYVDIFVDDFIGLDQCPTHQIRHVPTHQRLNVCRTVFHALEKVFIPLDKLDPTQGKEFLSIQKLDEGDCSWSICQVLLGWMTETVNMTM